MSALYLKGGNNLGLLTLSTIKFRLRKELYGNRL